ncbi:lytic transglycosylase domain-containing protein [Yokenella regensburgei]|uniref:lytic transglycosylase domain-containing protein n=1 Tax=Yokenella regensburgei TaxID=158877 RepID=UPI001FD81505|nr:lytic transglycosylase domain-containing protein [Yokenella regensburgei]
MNNVPPDIVASVLYVEGGKEGSVSLNRNGSADLGVMQINDHAWLDIVSKALFHGDEKKAYHELVYDSCVNIKIGTWILSRSIDNNNGNVWKAVGEYHSKNDKLAGEYINRVRRAHDKFFS